MNFLKRLNEGHWFFLACVLGIAALAIVVHHESNDPVRNAARAKCEAFCGNHPVTHFYANAHGTFQCDCSAETRVTLAP
jgi:hypothetical protein